MSNSLRLFVALAALVPTALPAQDGREKERIRKEILEKQRLMREGKVVRTNVRVTVRLHNGSRLRGVVRHGRFVERVDGLTFVPADVQTPGAGLRLWYYDGTNSYIFLPYQEIKTHKIGERLTDEEVAAIAERFRQEAEAVKEREARRLAEQQRDPNDPADPMQPGSLGADPLIQLSEQELALLTEFPPEEGWSPERVAEIERKRVVLGVYPDAKSRRFVEQFEAWHRAFDRRQKRDEQRKAAEEQSGKAQAPQRGGNAPMPPGGGQLVQPPKR